MKRILLIMFMLVALMSLATAASVEPELVDPWKSGNAEFECEQAGGCGEFAYKIDEWGNASFWGTSDMDGIYDDGNITISNSDNITFDWNSKYPVCTVIVKGGPSANVYRYPGGVTSDTELVAPTNPNNGKPYEISHVTFCFNRNGGEIPEFPTVALPIAAVLGLAFLFQRRKE